MELPGRPADLLGLRAECALFDRWQDAVKAGRGGALVVVGEPGIGKSALLDHMALTAVGFHVVRAAGVEAEAELPFGGCIRSARRSWPHWSTCPDRSRTRWPRHSGCGPERRRTASC